MQSLTQAAPPREYRGCVPIDGYVHKFRLESREEAAAENWQQVETTPTVSLGGLLGKFLLSAVALAGIAAAGVSALI
ncbi:hypothetical protein [Peristeroidobacter soli]|jgi:hypothetical protein|uniref:hypothetical protein n=1 Tax=Peristeroidobacter soli TaxID=2497877 RepID=UPI00101E0CDA|nr:hypothetical protein [Peristeroidobacter soli]